ncbi:MAG: methyltransferase domain-containing protein [Steroidobacteraceae bacterium]|nr:methyltransferase domain-containing protein [Deltaproteobacteria bacterium]
MINTCPVCGNSEFNYAPVLWNDLISEWQLAENEVKYIDRQQGFFCVGCGNNLRSMALADAILRAYNFSGSLEQFVESDSAKTLMVLEINEAGGLTPVLKKLPNHRLVCYPEHDMTCLSFESATFDLVLHSDTLEHVYNPVAGLSECCRVLANNGHCIFTIPVIVDRFTRSRAGLSPSYHGSPTESGGNLLVQTEYGVDMWKDVLLAGFSSITVHCLEYPAGLALIARHY